jgi:hypothetical protein
MNATLPDKMKRGPSRLKTLFNGLVDFVIQRDLSIGAGLREDATVNGRNVRVSDNLLKLEAAYRELLGGSPSSDNPLYRVINNYGGGNGGGDGTGLPDVETDEDGNPTLDGQPLDWQTASLKACIVDDEGNKTPVTYSFRFYGTTPTTDPI